MKLDLILPTKGRRKDLEVCLKKLEEVYVTDPPASLEVGICISDSFDTPLPAGYFEEICPHIHVRYKHAPEAKSFIENHRNAIALSDADYGWLMGDDDYILPGSLVHAEELLRQRPSLIHCNTILADSHLHAETRLIPEPPDGERIEHDIPATRAISELTYASCLIFDMKYLRDPAPWRLAHPGETSIHLRCVCNAVKAGNALATSKPMVVMEKNAQVVSELAGLWCPLLGYEFPLTRHRFFEISSTTRPEPWYNVRRELRMHALLGIFRGSYPLMAIEAKEFRHENPLVPLTKKLLCLITGPRSVRKLLKRMGRHFDPRCDSLSVG